jgi:uncharacterized membrane protein YjfL (UPF0719 family)
MSGQQILFGVLEFAVSILVAFVLTFATYKLLLKISRRFDEENQLKRKNGAVGVMMGGILVGQAIIVKQSLYPVMAVFQLYTTGSDKTTAAFLKMLALGAGYIVLSGILAVAAILLAFWLFDKMTPGLDQYQEIRDGNLAVAIFMALYVFALSLLLSSGVAALTRALVPFPQVGAVPLV